MRRPCFKRWIRAEALRLSGCDSFSLRKFSALAQRCENRQLACALMLYAHENDQFRRFMTYIYDEELAQEYQRVEQHLGPRSIERLALRGIPMMSLPPEYREFLTRFSDAYHAPELIAQEKHELWESTVQSILVTGTTPTELANELSLDASNISAYIARGDVGRFTLDTIRRIDEHVAEKAV